MANYQPGNTAHGIAGAILRMEQGRPFVGLALDYYHEALTQYGYSETDLVGLGIQGAIIEKTCKLDAISKLLWSAILMTAELGDVQRFLDLEKAYGKRLSQSLSADYRLLELKQEQSNILDYEAILEAEDEDKDD
jgi:hypothetical protein